MEGRDTIGFVDLSVVIVIDVIVADLDAATGGVFVGAIGFLETEEVAAQAASLWIEEGAGLDVIDQSVAIVIFAVADLFVFFASPKLSILAVAQAAVLPDGAFSVHFDFGATFSVRFFCTGEIVGQSVAIVVFVVAYLSAGQEESVGACG